MKVLRFYSMLTVKSYEEIINSFLERNDNIKKILKNPKVLYLQRKKTTASVIIQI